MPSGRPTCAMCAMAGAANAVRRLFAAEDGRGAKPPAYPDGTRRTVAPRDGAGSAETPRCDAGPRCAGISPRDRGVRDACAVRRCLRRPSAIDLVEPHSRSSCDCARSRLTVKCFRIHGLASEYYSVTLALMRRGMKHCGLACNARAVMVLLRARTPARADF